MMMMVVMTVSARHHDDAGGIPAILAVVMVVMMVVILRKLDIFVCRRNGRGFIDSLELRRGIRDRFKQVRERVCP